MSTSPFHKWRIPTGCWFYETREEKNTHFFFPEYWSIELKSTICHADALQRVLIDGNFACRQNNNRFSRMAKNTNTHMYVYIYTFIRNFWIIVWNFRCLRWMSFDRQNNRQVLCAMCSYIINNLSGMVNYVSLCCVSFI